MQTNIAMGTRWREKYLTLAIYDILIASNSNGPLQKLKT